MADIEFFDLSSASEEEIKEIRAILEQASSNGCVELPWETSLSTEVVDADEKEGKINKEDESSVENSSLGIVVGQALLYASPVPSPAGSASQLTTQSPEIMTPVETFIPPPLSAASALGPAYPPAPYLVSRTVPYLRAYPHMGMPLITCALAGSGDLTHVPAPYAHYMPVAASTAVPPPTIDKNANEKEENARQKTHGPGDRQFNRRNKKKLPSGNFYNPSDVGQSPEVYQESMATEDQTLAVLSTDSDSLTSVPSSLPVVPVPVPPSTFAVTGGGIPLHGYPPGLHPLPYSQISGPQAPTTPVYYVPVFNHPHYSSYIPSPTSGTMMLPLGIPGALPAANESENVATSDSSTVAKSNENLVVSSESATAKCDSSANVESDNESVVSLKQNIRCDSLNKASDTASSPGKKKADICVSQENSSALTEMVALNNPSPGICREARLDSDRVGRWADLFKKQCPEVNGLDRRPVGINSMAGSTESDIRKEIANGKLHTVPNNEDIM